MLLVVVIIIILAASILSKGGVHGNRRTRRCKRGISRGTGYCTHPYSAALTFWTVTSNGTPLLSSVGS